MTIMRRLATALLLLAAPLLGLAQSIGGLTARATANAIAIRPTSIEGAALEDVQFSYSRDAGATWETIEASCLEFDSGEAIWHVLECLQIEVFEGSNIQFKASVSSCNPVAFDGYTYKVVQIGSQCWFAENLRSTHYANGDAIPGNLTNEEWEATSYGAQAVYNTEAANLAVFGRLYNWYAVDDERGLCPRGWEVPEDADFITLEKELGMPISEANSIEWRGTDEGMQMKVSESDSTSWDGTNRSNFAALPGGGRHHEGEFGRIDNTAFFWTSSLIGSSAWSRALMTDKNDVYRKGLNLTDGFSVRCVRD